MATGVIFGAFVPQGWKMELSEIDGADAQWAKAVEVAQLAEELGYDSVWLYDHVHNVPRPAHEAVFECWTTLAAISQVTRRVRLGQMVGCNSYRAALTRCSGASAAPSMGLVVSSTRYGDAAEAQPASTDTSRSRPAASSNSEATTFGLLTAAIWLASCEERTGAFSGCGAVSRFGTMPMTCWNTARALCNWPSAVARLARAAESRDSA